MTLYIERLTLRLFHIFIHNEDWIILLYVFSSKEKHILVVYLSFPRREQFKWENARIHGNIRVERQESDSPEYSAFSFFFLFWAQTIAMHFSSKSALERKTNYVYSLLLPYSYHLYFHSFINCLNHSSTRNHYEPKNHTVHNIVVSTSRSDQIIIRAIVCTVFYMLMPRRWMGYLTVLCCHVIYGKNEALFIWLPCIPFFFLYWRNLNNCDDKPIIINSCIPFWRYAEWENYE